jgi:hypothetical protein
MRDDGHHRDPTSEVMNTLLRALLLRNRYCAPVGADGEVPGGAAGADDLDLTQDDDTPEPVTAVATDEDGEAADGAATNTDEADDTDDLVITLEGQDLPADDGDELPANIEPKASAAFARMRADNKRMARELREAKAKQEAVPQAQPAAIEPLGDKPTMEDPDVDYDPEKYAAKLESYLARKAEHESRASQQQEAQRKEQEAWTARIASYKQEAAKLKRPDFEDAEAAVQASFSTVQQGLLLKHPKAAALVYVLGKNPARAKTLAAISDPVDFAYAAADLAGQVKVERKSPPPPTDTPIRGRTSGAALASQSLDALKEQGRRTGDYSAYFNAKRAAEARKERATA